MKSEKQICTVTGHMYRGIGSRLIHHALGLQNAKTPRHDVLAINSLSSPELCPLQPRFVYATRTTCLCLPPLTP